MKTAAASQPGDGCMTKLRVMRRGYGCDCGGGDGAVAAGSQSCYAGCALGRR
jgi:hypothetical protein